MPPTQYDNIGKRYNDLLALPVTDIENHTVKSVIGDMTGLRVLDLACGTGRYSRILSSLGAAKVLGIDISSQMIGAAQAAGDDEGLEFQVRDCSTPFVARSIDGQEGGFDMIFAGWLFNYAPNESTLRQMWDNVFGNLRPGGRLVAVVPNKHLDLSQGPLDDRYGITVRGVERVEHGWLAELTAYTEPPVVFRAYHLLAGGLYEQCAGKAGLVNFEWHELLMPEDERKDSGYWDAYLARPHIGVLTAWKPS